MDDEAEALPDLVEDGFAILSGGGGASCRRIEPRSSAETTNDAASIAIANGAVSHWTRKPLIPKAMNSAADPLAARAPLASTSPSRSTIVGR